jgi:hypothetical protein
MGMELRIESPARVVFEHCRADLSREIVTL